MKANDFKIIQRIRWRKFLTHSNWKAVYNSILQEDNFYKRRGLIDLLENYDNQDKDLQLGHDIITDSYLNASKFSILEVGWNNVINLWGNTKYVLWMS